MSTIIDWLYRPESVWILSTILLYLMGVKLAEGAFARYKLDEAIELNRKDDIEGLKDLKMQKYVYMYFWPPLILVALWNTRNYKVPQGAFDYERSTQPPGNAIDSDLIRDEESKLH